MPLRSPPPGARGYGLVRRPPHRAGRSRIQARYSVPIATNGHFARPISGLGVSRQLAGSEELHFLWARDLGVNSDRSFCETRRPADSQAYGSSVGAAKLLGCYGDSRSGNPPCRQLQVGCAQWDACRHAKVYLVSIDCPGISTRI